jgi:hypothetical protein
VKKVNRQVYKGNPYYKKKTKVLKAIKNEMRE